MAIVAIACILLLIATSVIHYEVLSLLSAACSPFTRCLYFSAETYTTLGYGDVLPHGDLRLLAGLEALNGMLLIGWTASYTYLSMARFWNAGDGEDAPPRRPRAGGGP